MSLRVDLGENQDVRITSQLVDAAPPTQVEFAVEGVFSMTEELLGRFAGSSVRPVAIELTVDGSQTVEIDLRDEVMLELDAVNVGVATPDADDLSPGVDSFRSSSDDADANDEEPGAIAFTVEGTIRDVPTETCDRLTDESPSVKAITLAVDGQIVSDGGSGADVIFETILLGYGIAIHRNGRIDVRSSDGVTDVGFP